MSSVAVAGVIGGSVKQSVERKVRTDLGTSLLEAFPQGATTPTNNTKWKVALAAITAAAGKLGIDAKDLGDAGKQPDIVNRLAEFMLMKALNQRAMVIERALNYGIRSKVFETGSQPKEAEVVKVTSAAQVILKIADAAPPQKADEPLLNPVAGSDFLQAITVKRDAAKAYEILQGACRTLNITDNPDSHWIFQIVKGIDPGASSKLQALENYFHLEQGRTEILLNKLYKLG